MRQGDVHTRHRSRLIRRLLHVAVICGAVLSLARQGLTSQGDSDPMTVGLTEHYRAIAASLNLWFPNDHEHAQQYIDRANRLRQDLFLRRRKAIALLDDEKEIDILSAGELYQDWNLGDPMTWKSTPGDFGGIVMHLSRHKQWIEQSFRAGNAVLNSFIDQDIELQASFGPITVVKAADSVVDGVRGLPGGQLLVNENWIRHGFLISQINGSINPDSQDWGEAFFEEAFQLAKATHEAARSNGTVDHREQQLQSLGSIPVDDVITNHHLVMGVALPIARRMKTQDLIYAPIGSNTTSRVNHINRDRAAAFASLVAGCSPIGIIAHVMTDQATTKVTGLVEQLHRPNHIERYEAMYNEMARQKEAMSPAQRTDFSRLPDPERFSKWAGMGARLRRFFFPTRY